jgi:hypothetical protein
MPSRLPSRGISLHSSLNSKRNRSEGRNLHSDERNRKTGSSSQRPARPSSRAAFVRHCCAGTTISDFCWGQQAAPGGVNQFSARCSCRRSVRNPWRTVCVAKAEPFPKLATS